MRVVVVGATGNVGTSTVRALLDDKRVDQVVGVSRRALGGGQEVAGQGDRRVEWRTADVRTDDLVPIFRGADAVVHLAWALQPSHHQRQLHDTNVVGSERVFQAVAAAEVQALVYASSVGAYSPSPDEQPVDESWPTHGIATSSYSRQKAYVERLLDVFEARHPIVRVVRLRPALVFQGPAAAEIRRLFLGHLVPRRRPAVLPSVHGLRFQAVHADDVGVAYARAVGGSVRGPFNVAADPVLDLAMVARALGARPVPVPSAVLRAAAGASWRLHLQPTDPGWVDLALRSPLLDTTRARQELGWTPTRSSLDAVTELVEGLADHRAGDTPPLASDAELAVVAAHAASPFRHDPA